MIQFRIQLDIIVMTIFVRSISEDNDHVFLVSAFSVNWYLTVWQTKLNLDVSSAVFRSRITFWGASVILKSICFSIISSKRSWKETFGPIWFVVRITTFGISRRGDIKRCTVWCQPSPKVWLISYHFKPRSQFCWPSCKVTILSILSSHSSRSKVVFNNRPKVGF